MARVHVQLRGVTKRFGAFLAVDDVSLDVLEGSFTTLLGPSGCGKTTTLRIVAGFYAPDRGDVLIGGARVNDIPPHRRNTTLVFQEYALFPHMTVAENVAYGLRMRRVPRVEQRHRVARALEMVGLSRLEEKFPHQLSGGQQQRVAVARALVVEPEVLLLDEPLSNLDAKLRTRVRTELRQLQQALGKTTLYVTHDQEEALSMSDRIAVMDRGRVVQVGPPHEIYSRPATRFVADFVGLANFAPGRVGGFAGAAVEVDTAVGRLLVRCPERRPAPGDAVMLVIRPEAVRLRSDAPPAGGPNVLKGVIAARSFLGGMVRYWVDVGTAERWIADLHAPGGRAPFEGAVFVEIVGEDVHLLLETGAAESS
jgi:ABC-type Fe3+/spermidine/putrescine transport system ATPase subunit